MGRNSRLMLSALLAFATTLPHAAWATAASTVTTLALSSSSVASPNTVTLTASVAAGGAPVAAGSVTFCDAAATYCEDAALVGRAQLNGGSAILRFVPAIGTHTYKAIFSGTATALTSFSSTQTLTVTGRYPTTTAIAATGNPSGYGLTATVVGPANNPPLLSGTVSFQDTTNGNYVLGTASLGTPSPAVETFLPAAGSPVQTGNQPAIAGVGDFNEDGIPDLAVENAGDNTISILLGNGKGGFTLFAQQPPITVGTPPCENINIQSNCAIVVGDFDDDGHADLAVTSGNDNTVTVLKGNGKGTFTPFGPSILVGNYPEALKIGDFNNDGNQDLAVANANDNTVSILLGDGKGGFSEASGSPFNAGIGNFPFFIAVADFNNDANLDLAVVNGRDNTVSFLRGNGDGTFTSFAGSPFYFPTSAGSGAIVAAYFGEDTNVDLAIANFNENNVYILLGNGDGTFQPSALPPITVGPNPFAMVALDYNGDSYTDLAVVNYNYNFSPNPPVGTVTLLKGNVDGSFSPGPEIPVGQLPNDVVTADFNGDGTPDLAIPDSDDIYTTVLLNTWTQTATASLENVTFAGTGTHYVDAVYGGNASFAPSTSTTIPLQGLSVATSLTLSASPTEQMVTMPVTFTAQLASLSNEPPFATPAGTVTFFDTSMGVTLGTAPMGANGQAVYTTSSIVPGVHAVTASYNGDAVFLASSSNQITVKIDELRITLVGNNNNTFLPGTTVAYTLQVMPQVANTFLYTVSFAASGLPAGAIAAFSPATLAPGGATANIKMTVVTANTALNATPPSPYERLPLALGLLLPLFGAAGMRRRTRKLPPLLGVMSLAALSLAAVAGLSGCSGAGLFAARKVTYTITVTATEGTLQRSTTVPLAIQ